MKYSSLLGTLWFCALFSLPLDAQPVTFTFRFDLLNPVSGFADYSDCVVDMNGDYLDDVVRVGGKGIFIDFQQTDGSFHLERFTMPIQSLPDWSICAGDLDNDGYNDLLLAGSSSVSFVMASGNGTSFTENVMPVTIYSQRSTMADINNDGWLDAFVCNEKDQSYPFRNDGDGIMTPDTNFIHTPDLPGNYAALWTDYDNDGDTDLYITKCYGISLPGDIIRTNLLYRNNGDGTYTEVGAAAGLDDNAQSWSTVFEDFDGDGDFDAFIVNHDFQNRLFRNNGDDTFTDIIADSGIDPNDLGAFENASGDFNNDGFIDIFAELISPLYLSHGDLTFTGQDAPVMPGAIGDLNNDGFLDVIRQGQLWLNNGNSNHWLKVHTRGVISNRNGIGARVELYGNWGLQIREVRSGQSFSPMSSLAVHFGLGQSDHVDSLVVKWPSGIRTILSDLAIDTAYVISEASCLLPATVLSVNGETQLCPGDTIELSAPEGFESYTWSTGEQGNIIHVTNAGNYDVLLQDTNGCVSISDVVVVRMIEEYPPVITASDGNRFCQSEIVFLTSSQGDNYTWSNGLTGQSIGVTESGNYSVASDAICIDEQLVSEPYPIVVLPSSAPLVTDVSILPGDSIVLTAIGENCIWYNQPEGGNLLHDECLFQTPALDTSAVFYVESHTLYPGEILFGGKIDTSGSGGLPAQGGYLFFETWEPFVLLSVIVYVPEGAPEGVRFIQLYTDDTLQIFRQFEVHTGMNELQLDFAVPVGKHSLRCPQANLFRNSGPLNYPYPLGEAGQITGSYFGEDYYYYFYNWKIQTPDHECVSPRVPVSVNVTSVHDEEDISAVKIYPNPTSDHVFIELQDNTSGALVRIFDVLGVEVFQREITPSEHFELDLKAWPNGSYLFQIIQNENHYLTKVIVN